MPSPTSRSLQYDGGGVDEPVARRDRRFDGADGLLGRALEDAEPERRHLDAVVQREEWTRAGHWCHRSVSPFTRISGSSCFVQKRNASPIQPSAAVPVPRPNP